MIRIVIIVLLAIAFKPLNPNTPETLNRIVAAVYYSIAYPGTHSHDERRYMKP